jgi:hypothetical protein
MKSRSSVFQRLQRAAISSPLRWARFAPSRPARNASHSPRTYATVSAADLQFGQPVYETHPHLLRAGESEFPFCKGVALWLIGFYKSHLALLHRSMRTVEPGLLQAYLPMGSQCLHPQIRNIGRGRCPTSFIRNPTFST